MKPKDLHNPQKVFLRPPNILPLYSSTVHAILQFYLCQKCE